MIRRALLAGLVYGGYVYAFPVSRGPAYHVMALSCLAAGVVALWFFTKFLDLGEGALKALLELSFLVIAALLLGFTMPQRGGGTPLSGPAARAAKALAGVFPKR